MIVWKKLANDLVACLRVTGQNNCNREGVINDDYAKFRCYEAEVLSIEHMITKQKYNKGKSWFDRAFEYEVGKIVKVENCNLQDNTCGLGIHFFKTYDAAFYFQHYIIKTSDYTGYLKLFDFNGGIEMDSYYVDGKRTRATSYQNNQINTIRHFIKNWVIYEEKDKENMIVDRMFLYLFNNYDHNSKVKLKDNTVYYWSEDAKYLEEYIDILQNTEILKENKLLKLELQRLNGNTDILYTIEKIGNNEMLIKY